MSVLPTPDHPIVLFDGVCNLCNASVNFIIDRDPGARFRFAALQSEIGARLAEGCGRNPDEMSTVVLIEDGRCYTRSTAALRILRRLEGPWSWLWAFRAVPRPLRDAVYHVISENRYLWFGKQDVCRMPTPELRLRFLDADCD